MYHSAEDKAIHDLANAVMLLIQLLQQKQVSDEEKIILDEAAKLTHSSIVLVK